MTESQETGRDQVGRYHLVERLAVGGMAEIFLACERGAHDFERLVVIKKMLPHIQNDESFVKMFLQEARVCARINHPNVVRIIELGEHDELPFMAMEYVDGSTLRELILAADKKRFHIPPGIVVDLMAQAAAGSHAVHVLADPTGAPMKLVHRDISPHNLMVTTDGHVKLLDFGIVKGEGGERTRTGILKGKLSYMSPEQCQQGVLDARSDIYALGIVLWELLAGEKLFAGKSELQTMQSIISGKLRDIRSTRKGIAEPLAKVVDKALATKRDERFETADDLRRALLSAAEEADLTVSSDTTRQFVAEMLGAKHKARKQHVTAALDRTMVTGTGQHTRGSIDRRTTMTQTRATTYGVAGVMGGLMVSAGGVALVVAAIAVLGGVVAWQNGMLGTEDPHAKYVTPEGEPVRLRFAPTIDSAILLDELEPFRRYLEHTLQQPVEFSVGASYQATADSVVSGDVNFASLPPAITMQTLAAHSEIEIVAGKLLNGSTGTEGVLLVHEGSPIFEVKDLEGKRICYPDPNSTTGSVLPRVHIRKQGLDPDTQLTGHIVMGNHLEVIRGIVDDKCDVGGVYRGALDEADDKGIASAQTRILAITGRTPHDAIAAGPSATVEQRHKLSQALLALDPMKEWNVPALGEMEKLSGWIEPDQQAYDRLQAAVDEETAIAKAGTRAPTTKVER